MNKKNLGIREIAKLAGVSVATVSRVINAPEKTSETIRDRVNRVILENNYVPNMNAKNLFAGTSNAFALFIYDMENPYFTPLIKKHLDALIGEYLGTPIIPKVTCKDEKTVSTIFREK